MTHFPEYELRQGGRSCLFDGSQGVKKSCEDVGFQVEVLKDKRIKIQVDGHIPKVYSPPDCKGYLDEYYCSYPIKPRLVERDTDPWWCKLHLKKVCEGRVEEKVEKRVITTTTVTEVKELRSIIEVPNKAAPSKGDLPTKAERLKVVSNTPARYQPKRPDEKILFYYPKTRRVIESVASSDRFAKGALTIEALKLAKIARKKKIQPDGPESKEYTDAWIAKKISAKYQEMKRKFE